MSAGDKNSRTVMRYDDRGNERPKDGIAVAYDDYAELLEGIKPLLHARAWFEGNPEGALDEIEHRVRLLLAEPVVRSHVAATVESSRKYRGEPNQLAAALFELVDCKKLKDSLDAAGDDERFAAEREEYNRRKPAAWAEACRVLTEFFSAPSSTRTLGDGANGLRWFLETFLKALDMHNGHGTPSLARAEAYALEAEARLMLAGHSAASARATTPCEWTPDDDGIYQTTCGNAFTFIDAGPKENHMKFCCYCGGGMVTADGTAKT